MLRKLNISSRIKELWDDNWINYWKSRKSVSVNFLKSAFLIIDVSFLTPWRIKQDNKNLSSSILHRLAAFLNLARVDWKMKLKEKRRPSKKNKFVRVIMRNKFVVLMMFVVCLEKIKKSIKRLKFFIKRGWEEWEKF